MPNDTPAASHRIERTLAVMAVSLIGLSLLCIAAVLVGASAQAPLREGVWPVIQVLPLLALPIGFLLLVVFLITTAVRRRRSDPDAGR